ncbi:MAG: helix-turn-helix transcriptional regulator [Actinobacteria bacterium]|nr:helix-turn-helix transcriptional regulator [Actinomycetota bacterium]
MAARSYGQYCGVTTAIELIGERWALLIVRDLLVGPRRYSDLKQGLARIPTNILSTRLKELQAGGVVRRAPMRGRGLVYELTEYGRALEPIVLALGRWGFQAMGDPGEGDLVTPDSLTMALRTAFQPDAARDLDIELHVGEVALRVTVRAGTLGVVQLAPAAPPIGGRLPEADPEAVLVAEPGIRHLIGGRVTPGEALAQGLVHVTRGDVRILDTFADAFRIDPLPA